MSLDLFLAAVVASATPQAEPPGSYLLSIEGIELGESEFVDGFSVDTWDVDLVAVCHIPPGWQIRAGRQASPDGVLAGEGSHGVTWLNRAHLGELRGLALIQVDEPVSWVQVGNIPPTFSGRAGIGRYGIDESRRELPLTAANIRLLPATRCPDREPL